MNTVRKELDQVYQSDTPEHIDAEVAAPEPAGDDLAEELIAADIRAVHSLRRNPPTGVGRPPWLIRPFGGRPAGRSAGLWQRRAAG